MATAAIRCPFGVRPRSQQRLLQKMPKQGDVVVFRLPRDPSQTYIKRVIGLPGDRIQMIDGRLWINGKELALRADGRARSRARMARSQSRRASSRRCPTA